MNVKIKFSHFLLILLTSNFFLHSFFITITFEIALKMQQFEMLVYFQIFSQLSSWDNYDHDSDLSCPLIPYYSMTTILWSFIVSPSKNCHKPRQVSNTLVGTLDWQKQWYGGSFSKGLGSVLVFYWVEHVVCYVNIFQKFSVSHRMLGLMHISARNLEDLA